MRLAASFSIGQHHASHHFSIRRIEMRIACEVPACFGR
jgi:hypothetical protein